jgi:hypothetical protein
MLIKANNPARLSELRPGRKVCEVNIVHSQ